MAVETNKGNGTSAPPTGSPSPASTLAGMPAVSANGLNAVKNKRRRPSSLMAQAAELPSVESSLDEFIARANETLVDPSTFNTEKVRAAEDDARKEADALRWRAAEQQMMETAAREQSLRRQLDGLQGKLAEAEARAAVAGAGGPQDGVVADLKVRLSSYDQKLKDAQEHSQRLARELEAAKMAQQAVTAAAASDSLTGADADELEQRARLAEAKAAKALAAARAAAAGLTVSQADLAAIESGLVVAETPKKGMSWGMILAAFIVGGALCFAAAFVLMNKNNKAATTPATPTPAASANGATQPGAQAPTPNAAPTKVAPVVTPIDDDSAKAAPATDDKAAAPATDDKAAAPATDDKAAMPKADDKADKAAAAKAAAEEKAAKAAEAKAAAQQAAADKAAAQKAAAEEKAAKAAAAKASAPKATTTHKAATPKTTTKASSGGLADPFGGSEPAPKKKAEKKKADGLADPFAN